MYVPAVMYRACSIPGSAWLSSPPIACAESADLIITLQIPACRHTEKLQFVDLYEFTCAIDELELTLQPTFDANVGFWR